METVLQNFMILAQLQKALLDSDLTLSKTCLVAFRDVSLYETREVVDDNDKPTGEVVQVLTLNSGREIELTKDQNLIYQARVNEKLAIDDKVRAYVKEVDRQLFSQS